MPQGDGVGRRIKTNFMRAGMCARPIRVQAHCAVEAARAHLLRKFFQCARRRVFFRGVVNFPAPRFVVRVLRKKRRGVRHGLHEKITPTEKFGAQTSPVPLFATASRTEGRSPNHPVVPLTELTPIAASRRIFSGAASGEVNSTATSTP